MQVHNLVDVRTHLTTLRGWKEQGRTRYIGITHYNSSAYPEVAKLLRTEKVDFVQINYSLGEREAEREILPLAQERGVAVLINRPFGGGDLFSRVRQKPLPDWASEFDCRSWAQFLLKWIIAYPAVTCAIPATGNVRHLEDNMEAGLVLHQIILRFAQQIVLQRHRVVGLGIHEMVSVVVLVTELDRGPVDIHQLDFVGRTETHIGALAGIDVANNCLNECPQVSRGAVIDFQNNGGVAIVFYRHSFSEIVRSGHGSG
jgi:predicted aldo/keto reductase-like oxidoreductase